MRVQATFAGLLANVTASHIHAATVVAGTGTAGVSTTLPTFPGFPSGVTAGTYDQTFDMLLSSSYNPTYVSNNGDTTASAWAALRTAISAGKSYLNIHSTLYPGGEIRGFLNLCPTINVSIPDAFVLPAGVLPNTVYPAYAPASSLTLQSNVNGGTSPYNYNWSNGATTSSITVSPASTTNYTLIVKDQNWCTGTDTKTVNVVDISGGNKGDKIVVCHHGDAVTIAGPAVANHLQHGDMLSLNCEHVSARVPSAELPESELAIKALGNPSYNHFDIQIRSKSTNNIQLNVYDHMGRIIESKSSLPANQALRLGSSYQSGIYFVEIVQGLKKQILKLVKIN